LSYDPVSDFAPVSMLGHSPFVLALHPGVPAQSVQELIALARAKPRKLNYASAGPATLAHLSGALFEKMAKIELTHVPYRGTAQSAARPRQRWAQMQVAPHPPAARAYPRGQAARTGGARRGSKPAAPRRADHRQIGARRLRMLAVAGDRRAGRHIARHHRALEPRDRRRPRRSRRARRVRQARRRTASELARGAGRAHSRRRGEVARRHHQRGHSRELMRELLATDTVAGRSLRSSSAFNLLSRRRSG